MELKTNHEPVFSEYQAKTLPGFCNNLYSVTFVGCESILYPVVDKVELGVAALNVSSTLVLHGILAELDFNDLICAYAKAFDVSEELATKDVIACIENFKRVEAVSYE